MLVPWAVTYAKNLTGLRKFLDHVQEELRLHYSEVVPIITESLQCSESRSQGVYLHPRILRCDNQIWSISVEGTQARLSGNVTVNGETSGFAYQNDEGLTWQDQVKDLSVHLVNFVIRPQKSKGDPNNDH